MEFFQWLVAPCLSERVEKVCVPPVKYLVVMQGYPNLESMTACFKLWHTVGQNIILIRSSPAICLELLLPVHSLPQSGSLLASSHCLPISVLISIRQGGKAEVSQ